MRMFLKNLSIRFKILIPVVVLGCLMFVLGLISIRSIGQIKTASDEISGTYAIKIEHLGDVTSSYPVSYTHLTLPTIVGV